MDKENIVLLGDGFFARGFLSHINYAKFNVTQIYRDKFINPQDIIYSLQRNIKYSQPTSIHFRDFFIKQPNKKVEIDINHLAININNKNTITINKEFDYSYDHLVIGLGSQKSLKQWSSEINNLVDIKNKSIDIVGMGPTGVELANILSKDNKIVIYDLFPKDKILNYISTRNKKFILKRFDTKNIDVFVGNPYQYHPDPEKTVLFCGGSKINKLVDIDNIKVNGSLQLEQININNNLLVLNNHSNIYLGGDCVNSGLPKTAQVAYQQGVYVAKRLNGDIPMTQDFEYKHNGLVLNLGDKKVLVEGHKLVPDGVYPDIILKLYSFFCI
jgi:NADH dehydrogenase FAD-containing subunit